MTFSLAQFQRHLGSSFSALLPNGEEGQLLLQEVQDRSDPVAAYCAFSLFFVSTAVLPQGTYALRQPQLGELFMFLTPIADTGQGMRYQACFNLEKRAAQCV